MIYRIFAYIFGYYLIKLKKSPELASLLIKKEFPISHMYVDGDLIVIHIISFSKRKVVKKLSLYGYTPIAVELHGLLKILSSYKRRVGIILGIPIFIAIISIGSVFVWEIHVVGNDKIDDEIITAGLTELGFSVGSYIPSVDVKSLCNNYLSSDENISWISVNIIGTRAEVQVRERIFLPKDTAKTPSNLIAERDGVIDRIELVSGQSVVAVGESVRAGQVLVSGYYQGTNENVYILEPSVAKIYAKTTREFTVKIPISGEEERTTGNISMHSAFTFFGRTIGRRDSGSPYEKYAVDTHEDMLTLFGKTIPIGIKTTTYKELDNLPFKLSEDDARLIAKRKISELAASELSDADVLMLSESEDCDGVYFTVRWMVYCIENIASPTQIVGAAF